MHVVNEKKYNFTISPNTIDKLGVKLYDKASDVVSELVANSYDADAENVRVTIPLGEFLATKSGAEVKSKDLKIIVEDDGHGFSESEANDFYLKVGADRRKDPARKGRGARSLEHDRQVMGRKGIGKLAAFGICKRIEVWSASGEKQHGPYRVSHFVLDYDDIIDDAGNGYNPPPGDCDGGTSPVRGNEDHAVELPLQKNPRRGNVHAPSRTQVWDRIRGLHDTRDKFDYGRDATSVRS